LVSAIVLANPGAVDTVKLATTRLPLTSVAHTASVPTVVVGHPVTLTAIPYGGDTVEYRFEAFYKDAANKSVWFVLRQYSKDATFIWTPALAKDWTVVVYAREVGTTGRHTVYKTTRVNVTPS
jgi:hypothetical protein